MSELCIMMSHSDNQKTPHTHMHVRRHTQRAVAGIVQKECVAIFLFEVTRFDSSKLTLFGAVEHVRCKLNIWCCLISCERRAQWHCADGNRKLWMVVHVLTHSSSNGMIVTCIAESSREFKDIIRMKLMLFCSYCCGCFVDNSEEVYC